MNKFACLLPVSRSGRLAHGARLLCTSLLLIFLVSLTGCGEDDNPTFPSPPDPEFRNWLFDITGSGPNDIWACGNGGAMFHFDGTGDWESRDMGSTQPVVMMYRDATGGLYACGHGGRIWRNSGTQWSLMDTGTEKDLYGLGSYLGNVHAVGRDGILLRLGGSTWSKVNRNVMVLRDETGAPVDTLYQDLDVEALVTVNNFAIGGAYLDPKYDGVEEGMLGTLGMILAEDNEYDWILRPLGGDQLVDEEWILSNISDPEISADNYLGTSEGWLFRRNDDGSWVQMRPKVTKNPGGGIRDIWKDSSSNLYIATDEGQIVFQTWDYNFVAETGRRVELIDMAVDFAAIWGTSSENLYLVGFFENQILHGRHNTDTDEFEVIEWIDVEWAAKGLGIPSGTDHIGLPRN